VWITAEVAEQLRLLHADPDHGGHFLEGLGRLSRDVALAVPSSLAVTIRAARLEGEVSVSALAQPAAVLASLAVRLPAGAPGDLLILRAGAAGAYLLLADGLNGLLGPEHAPAEVDKHLSWPILSSESPAARLADLGSIDQAIGVLVDRGLPPEEARRELQRRAETADDTIAAVSRELVASPRPDAGPG
jgi:hypothetical protein